MLLEKHIQPGYSTGHCSPEVVERVNCAFAKQVYARFVNKKYGVNQGLLDEYDKWFVKKTLLDFNMAEDPDLCKTIVCTAPCHAVAKILSAGSLGCPFPEFISGNIPAPPSVPCLIPTNLTAVISYDN